MIPTTRWLWLALLLPACAGANKASQAVLMSPAGSPGLFVGHTDDGEVVVAATHYKAMNGLATTDVDLGLPARKDGSGNMLCARQVTTGTHIPRWICRYQEDVEAERVSTQNDLNFLLFAGRGITVGSKSSGATGLTSRPTPP